MRLRARVDDNQQQIVRVLRQYPDCTVVSLASVGRGTPDLLLGTRGQTFLLELKSKGGKLNEAQVKWHGAWCGNPVVVLRSVDDAVKLMHNINEGIRHGITPGKALPDDLDD
tara:strand:+ start:181 stop:516 length:336 start_codon:yes stop_codon:yes gene_type:complete